MMKSSILILFSFLAFQVNILAQGDTLTFSFSDQGYERSYTVYVPEAYNGTEEWPVVFNFHGYSINASVQMLWTGMNAVADTGHFLLVYPEGLLMKNTNPALAPQGPGWNAGSDSDTVFFSAQPVDEATFVSNLIDQVDANFNVDLHRVYTTGWSNGGMQSTVLACELSDRIAAAAPIGAAGDQGRPCNPERIMPILYTHGTADPLVNYEDGGANPNFWGIPGYLAFWADKKGCSAIPDTVMVPNTDTMDSSTVEIITWNDCSSPLIHHRIVGGGHTWSGGPPLLPDFVGAINQDINSGAEVWKFFKQFSHPNPRTPQIISDTLVSGDSTRTYLLYVPAAYDGSEEWPLVINYHGFTNSSDFQMALTEMNAVADTGQFLVAYPQGLLVSNPFTGQIAPGWNLGGDLSPNDDITFTSDLIDQIAAQYAVDPARVYATGWSMGGNMSYDVTFYLSDRIAGFAPVGGQMTEAQIDTLTADRPIPMLQMHGTADPIVPFNGAVFPDGTDSFDLATRTAMYWAEMNGCSTMADTTQFADVDTTDQSTVTLYSYGDCEAGTEVLFYEITGGGHTWSGGAPLPDFLGPVNRDIHASSEIWNFFNRHLLPDLAVNTTPVSNLPNFSWQLYPNPFREQLMIDLRLDNQDFVEVRLLNLLGQTLYTIPGQILPAGAQQLMIRPSSTLPDGMYLVEIRAGKQRVSRKVMYRK